MGTLEHAERDNRLVALNGTACTHICMACGGMQRPTSCCVSQGPDVFAMEFKWTSTVAAPI